MNDQDVVLNSAILRLNSALERKGSAICAALGLKPRDAKKPRRYASRAEQRARYLDCGPTAWDDIGASPDY